MKKVRSKIDVLKRWAVCLREVGFTWQSTPVPAEQRLPMFVYYLELAREQHRDCEVVVFDHFADGPDVIAACASMNRMGTVTGLNTRIGVISAVALQRAGFQVLERVTTDGHGQARRGGDHE